MRGLPRHPGTTRVGLQAAALGWDDPFNPGQAARWWRTGEGQAFTAQDPPPTPDGLATYLRGLRLDFYLHPVIPVAENYLAITEFARLIDMALLVGNEIGTINGAVTPGTNRYDPDRSLLQPILADGHLLGVVYDESEHLQIHPDQYSRRYAPDRTVFQWGAPSTTGLHPGYVTTNARQCSAAYAPATTLHEFVFPTLVHALARAGFVPTPKILKEACTPVQLAIAMGAAAQYERPLGICVDLWGPDVGPWFTRLWGSPGHSPAEFVSALLLGRALSPTFLYVENMDSLCRSTGERLVDTEFGECFRAWCYGDDRPGSRNSHFPGDDDPGELVPAVVVIYADRGDVAIGHWNPLSPDRESGRTFYEAMHVLTHGHALVNASTLHFSGVHVPAGQYPRTEETLADLPFESGEPDPPGRVHHFFSPLNSVAVFDEHVSSDRLKSARAIVVVGDTVPSETLDAVVSLSAASVDCVVARDTLPADYRIQESSHLIVADSILDPRAREMLHPHLGPPDLLVVEFAKRRLEIRRADGPDDIDIAAFEV